MPFYNHCSKAVENFRLFDNSTFEYNDISGMQLNRTFLFERRLPSISLSHALHHLPACLNPLTTNDNYSHPTLAISCELAQFLCRQLLHQQKGWERRRCPGDSAQQLLQLAVENPWLALGVVLFFFSFPAQTGIKNTLFTLQGLDFQHCRQLLVWRSILQACREP